jgi:hypothetical protein
MKYPYELSE